MSGKALPTRVLGVHPLLDCDDVYLVEIELSEPGDFGWSSVTQEDLGQPESNWQTAWDEQTLGTVDGSIRFAFFFHALQLDRPLLTQEGPLDLPAPTPIPDHLAGLSYEAP